MSIVSQAWPEVSPIVKGLDVEMAGWAWLYGASLCPCLHVVLVVSLLGIIRAQAVLVNSID